MKRISDLSISSANSNDIKLIPISTKLQDIHEITSRVPRFKSIDMTPKKFSRYIKNLRGAGKKVFDYIFSWRTKNIYLTNAVIAKHSECCTKTVQRWTTRFMQEGILVKKQLDGNPYAPNHFYLNPRLKQGDISWHLTQKNFSKEQKQIYNATGLVISKKNVPFHLNQTVPHSKHFSSSSSSIFIKNQDKEIMRVDTRERACVGDGFLDVEVFNNTNEENIPVGTYEQWEAAQPLLRIRARLKRKRQMWRGIMLSARQKEYLVNKNNRAGIKEYVYGPTIKPQIFTPLMDSIKREFELDDYTHLKLICFDDIDLQGIKDEAASRARKCVWGVKSRPGLFIKAMNDYVAVNGLKPDWTFFKALCGILDITQPTYQQILQSENMKNEASRRSNRAKFNRKTIAISQYNVMSTKDESRTRSLSSSDQSIASVNTSPYKNTDIPFLSESELKSQKESYDNRKKLAEENDKRELINSLPFKIAEMKMGIDKIQSDTCPKVQFGKGFILPMMESQLAELERQHRQLLVEIENV